ncbi:hypothetical protein VTK26DRAFT_2143 [Humicola hyalothermophila]
MWIRIPLRASGPPTPSVKQAGCLLPPAGRARATWRPRRSCPRRIQASGPGRTRTRVQRPAPRFRWRRGYFLPFRHHSHYLLPVAQLTSARLSLRRHGAPLSGLSPATKGSRVLEVAALPLLSSSRRSPSSSPRTYPIFPVDARNSRPRLTAKGAVYGN